MRQISVAPLLAHIPALQDEDVIGAHHCRQPVRNDHRGAARNELAEAQLHEVLRSRVECAGRFGRG